MMRYLSPHPRLSSRVRAVRLHLCGGMVLGLVGGLAGCSDGSEPSAQAPKAASVVAPAELVARSWPVQMSNDVARKPFEQHAGWGALFKRDLPAALGAFASDRGEGRGLARIHTDLAAIYSQAAWMGANATRHVYGTDRQPTDPAEADFLHGVAMALSADCAQAAVSLAKVTAPEGTLAPFHGYWQTWAAADGCPGALDLEALEALPEVAVALEAGTDPELPPMPHHAFTEVSDSARQVETAELTHLVALSIAHRNAAVAAAPEAEQHLVDVRLSPWNLPVLGKATEHSPLEAVDSAWLFLEFALVGADLYFLDAAHREGLEAVTTWKDRSILAAALAPAVSPDGLDVELVIDRAADFRSQLKEAMHKVSGSPMPFQPGFAQIGEVAVLRAGMIVADANEQPRDAGILRINAFERSDGPGRDPLFLISTAAWDAGNRSPLRAQEIVHGLVSRYPSIQAARYPLDALHIRLGRTAAPSTAVH